jgi:histidyl-tRNA synthetase
METVKGFQDKLGKEAEKRNLIKEVIRRTFEKYNYQQVETPIIEYEKFVKENSDENDETISDIFRLKDKGKRELALRYEFTFQLKRISKNQKTPYKRFQIGPVFRDEPVQGNRQRQFTQCDIDIIGAKIKDQAELLAATKEILDSLKIPSKIYVNNRKLLNEILEEQGIKNKFQAIKELDKLDKIPKKEIKENLKKIEADKLLEIFSKPKDFFKKYSSYKEIEELETYCKYYGIQFEFQPTLARGLSYYTGNIFEIKSEIKETICGGGTYEINGIESSGISLGLERLEIVSNILIEIERILVVSLGEDKKAIEIARKIRNQNRNVSVFFGKPSKALEYAKAYGMKKVIFVGKKEIEKKKIKIKNMTTGKETYLTIEKIKSSL